MKNDVSKVCSELQKVADDARSTFGSLSVEQLNWKPGEKKVEHRSMLRSFDNDAQPLFFRCLSGWPQAK
jgi:hypothetical protein